MNNLQRNINELCLTIPGAVKSNGVLNVTAAARAIGVTQPTLKRLLDGEHQQARPETEEILCKFFGVSRADLYGDLSISDVEDKEIRDAINLINNLPPDKHARAAAEINMLKMLLAKGNE